MGISRNAGISRGALVGQDLDVAIIRLRVLGHLGRHDAVVQRKEGGPLASRLQTSRRSCMNAGMTNSLCLVQSAAVSEAKFASSFSVVRAAASPSVLSCRGSL